MFAPMRQIVFFIFILLIYSLVASSEELRFSRIDERYGLKQGSVDRLVQDQFGFVWIGTEDGLARFDGNQVKPYRNDPDDSTSIPDNVITALAYSASNKLWVGTEADGASYYDYTQDSFVRLDNLQLGSEIRDFYSVRQDVGEVIARTNEGIFIIDQLLFAKKILDQQLAKDVIDIFSLAERHYALLVNGKRLEFSSDFQSYEERPFFDKAIKNAWEGLTCPLLVVDANNIFYCPDNESHWLNQLTNKLTKAGVDINTLRFNDFVEDTTGVVWLSSNRGLIRVGKDSVTVSQNIPNDSNSLSSDKVRPLLLGKNKKLFVGTAVKGLNILDLANDGIEYFRTTNTDSLLTGSDTFNVNNEQACGYNESDYNTVWAILKASDGALWVGNYSGLAVRPAGSDKFEDFSRIGTTENYIDVCSVWSLAEANGLLWFGTWNGLISYSKDSGDFIVYNTQATKKGVLSGQSLSGNVIRVLQYDESRNSLWVGTNGQSLNRIDFNTQAIHNYPDDSKDETKLPHPRIRSLYLDKDNNLWVGSGGGLSLWNEVNNTFRTIKSSEEKTQLSDEDVRAIYQQKHDSTLWVGTGNGLNLFDTKRFEVQQRISEKSGLPNSTLYSLLPDNDGLLWISTANGLSRFDTTTMIFDNYSVNHGLQGNEFNFNAWHKDKEGLLYFGGISGINVINPEKLSKRQAINNPVFTSVIAYDSEGEEITLARMLGNDSSIQIKTQERNLKIEYSLLSFGGDQNITSKYRLLPSFASWVKDNPSTHQVEYTNLTPGQYTLEVGSNNHSDSVTQLEIHIEPYFWETLWFKTLLGLTLLFVTVGLSVFMYKARLRRLIDQRSSQHYRIVEHELRPHLHAANQQLKRLSAESDLPEKYRTLLIQDVQPMLGKSIGFIEDLRSLLDVRTAEKTGKQLYMLEDIIDDVHVYFGDSQEQIVFNAMDDINVSIYENSLYLVLKNLISNALKYSEDGSEVQVHISSEGVNLVVDCVDFGIGIDPKKRKAVYEPYARLDGEFGNIKGLGIGLTIVRFIVQSYQGSIEISDNQPKGTHFKIILKGVVDNG